MKFSLFLGTIACLFNAVLSQQVVGYYPSYNQAPSAVRYTDYNHIVYFVFTTVDRAYVSTAGIPDSTIYDFVNRAKAAGVSTSYSVGGYTGSQFFSLHVSTDARRRAFAQALIRTQQKYGFGGIDIDWEFPGEQGIGYNQVRPEDTANLALFLQTLRTMAGPNVRLTMAASISGLAGPDGNKLTAPGSLSSMAASLDFITIMAYDVLGYYSPTTGPNSPLYDSCSTAYSRFSIDRSIKYYQNAGFVKSKMLIGLPTYSYTYTVTGGLTARTCPDSSKSYLWQERKTSETCGNYVADGQGQILYRTIVSNGWLNQGGFTLYRDTQSVTSLLYNPTTDLFIPTEDAWSANKKGRYITNQGLAGANLFDTDGDDGTLVRLLRLGIQLRSPRGY